MANRATFLHISDLHFGTIDPKTLNARAVKLCSYPVVAGLLGHSSRSMHYLESFHRGLSPTRVQLVVTGDLTAVAAADQFQFAEKFLGSVWNTPEMIIGLRQTNWREYSIPGNHDHWSGKSWNVMFGGPTGEMIGLFVPPWSCAGATEPPFEPFIGPRVQLDSGQTVQFLAIDSDADVSPYRFDRFMARGCFRSQIEALSRSLKDRPRGHDEVRVLLLHHSRACLGRALAIGSSSRELLDRFLLEQDVAVMLTGHTHSAKLAVHNIADGQRETSVLEARCGTTTQDIERYRKFARQPGVNLFCPTVWRNSLLVHEVKAKADGLYWAARVYEQATKGFAPATRLPDGGDVECEFRVWPSQRKQVLAATNVP